MKTINKYILKEWLGNFFVYFLIISLLFFLNFIYQIIKPILISKASFFTILNILINLIPSVITMSLPITFLLVTMLTYSNMKEHGEITIFQTMGIKRVTYITNVILFSFLLSVLMYFFNSSIAPYSHKNFKDTYTKYLFVSPLDKFQEKTFISFSDKKIYANKIKNNLLFNIYIFNPINDKLVQTISAKTARIETDNSGNIVMYLNNGRINILDKTNLKNSSQLVYNKYIFIIPSNILESINYERSLKENTSSELIEEIKKMQIRDINFRLYTIEYFLRYSLSVSIFVFALVGIILAHKVKKNSKSLSFILTIVVVGVYYFILIAGITISEKLENINNIFYLIGLFIMSPNIIFMFISLILYKYTKD